MFGMNLSIKAFITHSSTDGIYGYSSEDQPSTWRIIHLTKSSWGPLQLPREYLIYSKATWMLENDGENKFF
jgi:hypothetical protein